MDTMRCIQKPHMLQEISNWLSGLVPPIWNLAQDWKPRMLTDTAKVHIYAPDPEDCLLLHYEFTGIVKLDQVVCQLKGDEGITYLEDDFQLEMRKQNQRPVATHLEGVLFVCHIDYENNCSKIIRQKGKKKDKQNKP